MIMMNLIVSLIGKIVERNMCYHIQEDYKELNHLVFYYESTFVSYFANYLLKELCQ
jgi:hypothetical protein